MSRGWRERDRQRPELPNRRIVRYGRRVVEDELVLAEQLSRALGEAGYAVDLAEDGEHAEFLGNLYGTPVPDLVSDDFEVLVDGKRRPVVTSRFLSLASSKREAPSGTSLAASRDYSTNDAGVTGRQGVLAHVA